MPVMLYSISDLKELSGVKMETREFLRTIAMIGADVGEPRGDEVEVEFFPNRPDLYSIEGLARLLRSNLVEPGLQSIEAKQGNSVLRIDPSVKLVRPFMVGALLHGIRMDDKRIKSLMELQEKLHLTFGRKRKKVSIGVHDCRDLVPPFTFKAVAPESVSFVPLASTEKMNLSEILTKHEKGIAYAFLMKDFKNYPLLVDSKDQVLSFPPIINGTLTMVTQKTTDLFLDVTGTDLLAIKQALNMVISSIVFRGGTVESIFVEDGKDRFVSPDLSPAKWECSLSYCNGWLGTKTGPDEAKKALMKMGFGVEVKHADQEKDAKKSEPDTVFDVLVPPWRTDILHQVDFSEDMAIGLGYGTFKGTSPRALTFGKQEQGKQACEKLRLAMVQLGFLETMGLTLSSEKDQYDLMGFAEGEKKSLMADTAIIENPLSSEHTLLRTSILPTLLRLLAVNKHRELPQNLFEAGYVVREGRNRLELGAVMASSRSSFTQAKAHFEALLRDSGLFRAIGKENYSIEESQWPFYIPGRAAVAVFRVKKDRDTDGNSCGIRNEIRNGNGNVIVNGNGNGGKIVAGHFGEIHPSILEGFSLSCPVAAFNLDVGTLAEFITR